MNANPNTAEAPLLNTPAARTAFATTRTAVKVYAVLSTAALLAVVAVAGTGHLVNPFMWTRAVLLPFLAVLLHRLTRSTAAGSRRAYDRLRTIALVCPLAIAGVDLIPGICPWWYAALQTVCVLPILHIALTTRGPALRTAFPKPKSR
ncbi:hypothetical protein [Streptomyces sp. NPDC001594]|uniref:hypothetical protein n=1 Tax=Streptomyces sp. NPDC001594 TaxID=3364590 RepID=UPI0036B5A261